MCSRQNRRFKLKCFEYDNRKDESKALTKIYLSDMNATLIVGNTTLTKSGMMKHVNVSVKTIKYSKKITFGILVHVFVRMVSI